MADISAASSRSTAASEGHGAGGVGRRPHISRTVWLALFGMAWNAIAGRLLGFGPTAVLVVLGGLSPSRSPFRMAWNDNGHCCSLTEHPCKKKKKKMGEHHRQDKVNTPLQRSIWASQSGAWAAARTLTFTLASACQTREGPGCRAVTVDGSWGNKKKGQHKRNKSFGCLLPFSVLDVVRLHQHAKFQDTPSRHSPGNARKTSQQGHGQLSPSVN